MNGLHLRRRAMGVRRNVILGLAACLSPLLLSGLPLAVAPAAPSASDCPHAAEAQKQHATPDLARMGGGGRTLFY
jgi:hypothetical protein